MKATYGFRATMKARPRKGDAEQAEHQDEVLVGGKLNAGETR
ncbi:Hypothetical protein A7982_01355 [Minicystis rosea]|nr:Hypothetical protein A7982_01355 [Minicystis rosea]